VPAEIRSLADDVIAITGATSGIGAAAARQLVAAGAKVALGARHGDRLDAMVEELGADNAVAVVSDTRRPADNQALVDAARARFGKLTGLVANAGIGAYGSILDHDDELLARMIETNYSGTVWAIRAAVPALLDAGGGDIVIVASVAGLRGGADEAVYAGTKFAQVGLAGSLDRELRPKGIRVTAICPAGVSTEFAMGTGRTPDMPQLRDFLDADDVGFAITTVLQQPRRLRTTLWSLWSNGQSS
jgi:NADP-dependent 3-hydroxy acid dehydrogenase YdfG